MTRSRTISQHAALLAAAAATLAVAAPAQAKTTAKVSSRTLTVKGDSAANSIALLVQSSSPEILRVDVGSNGSTDFSFRRDRFEFIDVLAGEGADTVRIADASGTFTDTEATTIDGGADADVIAGGSGPEMLVGGTGNDVVTPGRGTDEAQLGAGDDTVIWNPGDGSDTIEGQEDRDSLRFTGNSAIERVALSAAGARLRLTRDIGGVVIDAGGLEDVDIATLGGSDTITVGDLSGTAVTDVAPSLALPGGGGDGVSDSIEVDGSAAADVVSVARTTSAADLAVTGLAATTSIAGLEGGSDRLTVRGQDGGDQITVDETRGAAAPVTLIGGIGDDVLTGGSGADILLGSAGSDRLLGKVGQDLLFGGTENDTIAGGDGEDTDLFGGSGDDTFVWNPGDDSDRVVGETGHDRLEVNGGNGAEAFMVTPNGERVRFDRLSPAPFAVDAGTIEDVVLNANGGDDTITAINGLAGLVGLAIDAGDGNDTVTGGDGDDVILGGDGVDTATPGRGTDVAFLGAGDDVAVWNPGDGSDLLDGGIDHDRLRVNGSAGSERVELSADGSNLRFTRDIGAVAIDGRGFEAVGFAALGGTDLVIVGNLAGTGVTDVDAELAGAAGGGDAANDRVAVLGTAGDDAITVAGASGTAAVTGLAARVDITGADPADALAIHTLAGADTVDSAAFAAGTMQLSVD